MAINSSINSDLQILIQGYEDKHVLNLDMSKSIGFQSKTEEAFFNNGRIFIEEAYDTRVIGMFYEWISFNLPSSVYTPDFMVLLENGLLLFTEVKGSKKQRHYQQSRYKVRIAASLNPFFRFAMATPVDKHYSIWEIDKIPFDKRLSAFLLHVIINSEFKKGTK